MTIISATLESGNQLYKEVGAKRVLVKPHAWVPMQWKGQWVGGNILPWIDNKVRGTKGEFWREDILDIGRVCIIEKVVEEIRNNRKLLQQIGWDNKDINLAQGKLGWPDWSICMSQQGVNDYRRGKKKNTLKLFPLKSV